MVTFSGTQLERIFTNEGNSVVMQHNDLADVAQWPLGVIMRYYIGLFRYKRYVICGPHLVRGIT
jgi:hypothetical protein